MKLAVNTKSSDDSENELDLERLVSFFWGKKWWIFGISFSAGIFALAISSMMPNIYRAEALLVSAEESRGGSLAALAGKFGGLANLAGIDFGKNDTDKIVIALEVLKSRAFIVDFINRRDVLIPLMAAKSWNGDSEELLIDSDLYDVEANLWVAKQELNNAEPSDWDAYKKFSSLMSVSQAKDTGLVKVSIDYISPVLAKQWVEWLIEDVNAQMRKRDVEQASMSIEYLKSELEKTPVAGMQQIFYQLIETQMQTIMLANVREQYVFKVIDPPVVPEEKISPRRGLIAVLASMLGFLASLAFVLFPRSRIE